MAIVMNGHGVSKEEEKMFVYMAEFIYSMNNDNICICYRELKSFLYTFQK